MEHTTGFDWVMIAERFGVPVVLLLLSWLGLSKIARWCGEHLVIPFRDRAIKYMDDHTAWMQSQASQLRQVREDYVEHHAWETEKTDAMDRKLDSLLVFKKTGEA